jgi:putative endonuclease
MDYFAYVLRSRKNGQLYSGHTDNLARRIKAHNAGKTRSIKAYLPYELVYYEIFNSRLEAIDREKYFKTAAGRRFIKRKLVI